MAAPVLAEGVRERLAELAMESARFEVALRPRPERGPNGDETIEFRIAPNPGVPAGPLREVGSGGELSRVMLALTGVAADAGGPRADASLLVFDEIDAGIGGHTARAVGERLRSLSDGRQVLCITHLPQVASLADPALPDRQGHGGVPGPRDRRGARHGRARRGARADAGGRRHRPRRPPSRPGAAEGRLNLAGVDGAADAMAFAHHR